MGQMKTTLKQTLKKLPVVKNWFYGRILYKKYRRRDTSCTLILFLIRNRARFLWILPKADKAEQISTLIRKVDICPIQNNSFFYSLDVFKGICAEKRILDNYTIDSRMLVQHSLSEIRRCLLIKDDSFAQSELMILDSLEIYYERCRQDTHIISLYDRQLKAIGSLFERAAETFFEGIQRILFFNQFLWQTGHTLNGLGHLDWILEDLYRNDVQAGILTQKEAMLLLQDFFQVLHEFDWFKSAALLGDTGQIIILGGRDADGKYHCNELTYMFIEVLGNLQLPDPKVLLRCTCDMPEDILKCAIRCINTGIGAPLLSNDDTVIPALISGGYDAADAYEYGTSACWEPLMPGISCEHNNITILNYAVPFVEFLNSPTFEQIKSLEDILEQYQAQLAVYIERLLSPLTYLQFEDDPFLSLISPSALERRQDIVSGGAKYNNLGLTSIGLATVVNSLLNLEEFVFKEKKYTLSELNDSRKNNFAGYERLVQELKEHQPCYGCDDEKVLHLSRRIIAFASKELKRYHTLLGGHFKFGLSSPSYVMGAKDVAATFDGRKDGAPFNVHISSSIALPPTELFSFAMKLDYTDNRLNGNVIDLFVSPGLMSKYIGRYSALLRGGFAGGIFQLQMNVVDSQTLIAAKTHPELFPQLVVRVWGFSAYFNDLPEEYKDVLIARAIENEKVA